MARIRHQTYSTNYSTVARSEHRQNIGENNDCAVLALAIVCGVSYEAAHNACRAAGRKPCKGTPIYTIINAAHTLGYDVRRSSFAEKKAIIDTYPERDRRLAGITTHHPIRFRRAWASVPTCMLLTRGHIAAFRDGALHDWSQDKAMRVLDLFFVTPIQNPEASAARLSAIANQI